MLRIPRPPMLACCLMLITLAAMACSGPAAPATPTVVPPASTPTTEQTPAEGGPVTVNLLPVKDNTLYEDAAGNLSNGAGNHIFAGLTSGGSIRRGLIAFDIAGNVPAGATIESVTLTLSMSRTQSGPMEVQLRKVLADWGEGPSRASGEEGGGGQAEDGDATWVHRSHPNEEWSNPGGDFAPAASASAEVARVGSYTWGPTEEMGADVQGWLGDAATNFGWALIADEAGITTAKRFDSRENPDEASRPVLTITYAP